MDAPDKTDAAEKTPPPTPPEAASSADKAAPPPPQKQPWDQQTGETAKSFAAFGEYLEEPADITLDEFATKTGRTIGSVWGLSTRHHWRERAAAWRQHLASEHYAAIEQKTKEQAHLRSVRDGILYEQQWEFGQALMELAHRKVMAAIKNPEKEISFQSMTLLASALQKMNKSDRPLTPINPREKEIKDFNSELNVVFSKPLPGETPGMDFKDYVHPGPDAAKPAPAPPPQTPIAVPTDPPPAAPAPKPTPGKDFANLVPGFLIRDTPPAAMKAAT
jgi:hypothetical protein